MAYWGTLVEWNDLRSFGFIAIDGEQAHVFVHISAFQPRPSAQARPRIGQRVQLEVGMAKGRKCAQKVRWTAETAARQWGACPEKSFSSSKPWGHGFARHTLLAVFVLLLLTLAWLGSMACWVFSLYAVMSLITFFAYWKDKAAARAGRWRTPESTLHALALLGGWPGAMLAQQWLRHKTSKRSFRWAFWLTVLANVALLLYAHSPWGREWVPVVRH